MKLWNKNNCPKIEQFSFIAQLRQNDADGMGNGVDPYQKSRLRRPTCPNLIADLDF